MINALRDRCKQSGILSKGGRRGLRGHPPYRMLFLLHLLLRAILEGPFDNVSLRRDTLDMEALVKL